MLWNGIEVDRYRVGRRRRPPTGRPRSSSAVTSRARASRCCSTRGGRSTATPCCGSAAPGSQTDELRAATGCRRRMARRDHRRPSATRRLRGATRAVRAVAARRVVRRGAARGDGGRHAGRGVGDRGLPERRPGRSSTRCSCRPATSGALRDALRQVFDDAALRDRLVAAGPGAGRASSRWPASPSATSSSTSRRSSRLPTPPPRARPGCGATGGAGAPYTDARPQPGRPTNGSTDVGAAIIVIVIVVLIVLVFVAGYNGLVRLRNRIDSAWSQIGVQLERRHDLIPNLIETVKGYAAHEKSTLEGVVEARNAGDPGEGRRARAAGAGRERADRRVEVAVRARRGLPRPEGEPELPRSCRRSSPRPRTGSRTRGSSTTTA